MRPVAFGEALTAGTRLTLHRALREYFQPPTGSNPWQPALVRAFTLKVLCRIILKRPTIDIFPTKLMVDVALKRVVSTDASFGLALETATKENRNWRALNRRKESRSYGTAVLAS
jgi:hypothetical protein